MPFPSPSRAVALDAVTCAAFALLLLGLGGPLAAATDLPRALLVGAGLVLIPSAALMAWCASRPVLPEWGRRTIVTGNVLWIAASLLLLLTGPLAPSAFGIAFVIGQALAVAVLTVFESRAAGGWELRS